jgi:hypothetical protein
MNILQNSDIFQRVTLFSVQTIGRVVVIGLVVALVSVWAPTEPFYELGQWIARNEKLRAKDK